MNLSVKVDLVEGCRYSAGDRSFPVCVSIGSDETVEIGERIDLLSIFVVNLDCPDVYYGYSRSVLGVPVSRVLLVKGEVRQIIVDAFELDENFDGYVAGLYRCEVKVQVYIDRHGQMRPIILRGGVDTSVVN